MNLKTKRFNIKIRDICFISVFAAIIAVCAQISIPMPAGIPFTFQTFAVPLAGIILGAKRGMLSSTVYVLIGLIGLPVFSGFKGGIGVLFSSTGGFILSFPLMALCVGIFSEISSSKKIKNKFFKIILIIIGLISGAGINYLFGILMFSILTSGSLQSAFTACVMPFIPVDIIKFILAGGIGLSAKKILLKSKLLI